MNKRPSKVEPINGYSEGYLACNHEIVITGHKPPNNWEVMDKLNEVIDTLNNLIDILEVKENGEQNTN